MTTLEIITLITAITGAACGILGAALGIINTWTQLSKNKVRLRVVPKIAFMANNTGTVLTGDRHTDLMDKLIAAKKPARLCVEITNLSAFSVTVHDVGFGSGKNLRHSILQPEITPLGKTWPARLEPRESVTGYAGIGDLSLDPSIVACAMAYAKTDCGTTVCGSSPFFKDYVRSILAKQAEGTKYAN